MGTKQGWDCGPAREVPRVLTGRAVLTPRGLSLIGGLSHLCCRHCELGLIHATGFLSQVWTALMSPYQGSTNLFCKG